MFVLHLNYLRLYHSGHLVPALPAYLRFHIWSIFVFVSFDHLWIALDNNRLSLELISPVSLLPLLYPPFRHTCGFTPLSICFV